MWPAVQIAMKYLEQFDHGGGIPENSGYPDQTYDSWIVRGVSAYCGGLWLAALAHRKKPRAYSAKRRAPTNYHAQFLKAQKTYIDKLWNGEYFRYDEKSEYRDTIQADQLAGQWYANMTGLGDLYPKQMQLSAAKKIFATNVMKFGNGEMGAANGMAANGSIIRDNEQAQEVWVGTSFGLAALLLSEGMHERGLSHRVGHPSRRLRNERLLVPHAGSLGRHRKFPRADVHATCRRLGDGNDSNRRPLRCIECVILRGLFHG